MTQEPDKQKYHIYEIDYKYIIGGTEGSSHLLTVAEDSGEARRWFREVFVTSEYKKGEILIGVHGAFIRRLEFPGFKITIEPLEQKVKDSERGIGEITFNT